MITPNPAKLRQSISLVMFLVATCFLVAVPASTNAAVLQEAPPTEEARPGKSKDLKKDKLADSKADDSKQEDEQEDAKDKKDEQEDAKDKKDEDAKDKQDAANNDSAQAEEERPRRRRRRQSRSVSVSKADSNFLKIFQPAIEHAAKATVEIKKDKETIALGAIVDDGGYVLTKHSELKSPLTCELNDGRVVQAYVFGVHKDTDLALLKIEADNLPVIRWANSDSLKVGHWLATVNDEDKPLGVGVVGVNARLIKPQSGFMGVNLRQAEQGVQITGVTEDSPAETGGLKPGDIVLKVNGESFTEINKLITKVKSFPPGEEIRLTLSRNSREIVADVVLGEERSLNPLFQRSNQQNTMGGQLSSRRQNFPMAFQHDTFLNPEDCGGPVVNIDGDVVGFNIARQGRVASLMLPASLVRSLVDEMKSGQWAPAVVNKDRIEEINRTLQELNTKVALSPMNDTDLKKQVKDLNKEEKKLRKELEETLQKRIRAEVELEQASGSFETANKEIERLKKLREELVTGSR